MAFTALPTVARLRAAILSALISELRPVTAVKSSDTSRTNNTASADPDLALALGVGTWDVTAVLFVLSAANAAGDMRHRWSWTGTMIVSSGTMAIGDSITSGTQGSVETAPAALLASSSPSGATLTGASTSLSTLIVPARAVVSVAGTLILEWAQSATNANATTLKAGSWVTARRTE